MIEDLFALSPALLAGALLVTLFASFVKGAVGFALPMLMISGLASFLDPELALAMLILPAFLTNATQALRQGLGAAWETLKVHWRYALVVLICIALSAQLVTVMPQEVILIFLGVVVTGAAILLLAGLRLRAGRRGRRIVEFFLALWAGIVGGIAGVWGPQTVMYLTLLETPKVEAVRAQGVIYGLGAVMLTLAHIRSGILNAETLPAGLAMLPACLLGMWVGFKVQDRMDQVLFRRATLIVLILAGLNLIRRGWALG